MVKCTGASRRLLCGMSVRVNAVLSSESAATVAVTPTNVTKPLDPLMPNQTSPVHDPTPILQPAFGFWTSKVLLTAVEMGLFTVLGSRRLTGTELGKALGLHPRGIADFLDGLVAMKFLGREGSGPGARYFNTPACAHFLDRNSPRYV